MTASQKKRDGATGPVACSLTSTLVRARREIKMTRKSIFIFIHLHTNKSSVSLTNTDRPHQEPRLHDMTSSAECFSSSQEVRLSCKTESARRRRRRRMLRRSSAAPEWNHSVAETLNTARRERISKQNVNGVGPCLALSSSTSLSD